LYRALRTTASAKKISGILLDVAGSPLMIKFVFDTPFANYTFARCVHAPTAFFFRAFGNNDGI
jgi:hypothetical protein